MTALAPQMQKADAKRLRALKRRVANACDFPFNTCGSSRHLLVMADDLSSKRRAYPMFALEPVHCAESIYAVVAALWEARTELARLRGEGKQ